MVRSLCLGVALSAALAGLTRAQSTDPVEVYNTAVQAIQEEKWDQGLAAVDGIIKAYGDEGKTRYGPVFGHFHFLRGLLLLGKKQLGPAGAAFQKCYEDFPNTDIKKDGSSGDLKPNTFRYQALVQWANVLMMQENFGPAADKYKIAIDDGNLPTPERWYVGVNRGRCLIKSGQKVEGYDLIIKPLASRNAPEDLRQTIFMILAEDWSPQMELRPVRDFLNDFRSVIQQDRLANRYNRNGRFLFLAQQAIGSQDPIRALAWYGLMVDPRLMAITDEEIADLKTIKVAKEHEAEKQRRIDEMISQRARYTTEYHQLLNGIGSAHLQMKNFTASFVAFRELSDEVPVTDENNPLYLHNTVVSAAQISRWIDAYRYGKIFMEHHQDHELWDPVSRVLVEVVFLRGEYQEAYDISGEVRQDMDPGTAIRDIPDFVFGASAFHLEKIQEAEEALDAYLKDHPEGQRREPAEFYCGLTKIRQQKWEEAAALLNAFIEKYSDSPMIPSALYQCALAEFMLDQFEPALAKLERVIAEFPNHEVIASSWNLKGDLTASSEDPVLEEVVTCYQNGKSIADQTPGQEETAAYSLWQLLIQTSDAEQWDTAEGHYDEFKDRHSESVYRLDVLVAALPLLVQQSRSEEALDALRVVIRKFQSEPQSVQLSEMFGTYLDFLKEHLESPQDVIAELEKQRFEPNTSPALDGWLRIGMIDVYDQIEGSEEALAQQLFQLHSRFQPEQHSNFVIVQLARWLARERNLPDDAKNLYDYLLQERPGSANYDYVLLDTAELQAKSKDDAQRAEAMAKFQEVSRLSQSEELQELSVLGMARLLTGDEKYAEAQPLWEAYLENRSWTVSRPEANYQYAHCLDQQGNVSDALKIYVSVYANFPGHLDWSTKAYLRTALILKNNGEDLKALLVLRDMIQRMGHHDHPGVNQAKKLFVKWRQDYQPDPKKEAGA